MCGNGAQKAVGRGVNPICVVVNGDEVIVSDQLNHHVQVFGLDGSFVRQWGGLGHGVGQFVCSRGIAVSKGEVFVASNHRVQVFK